MNSEPTEIVFRHRHRVVANFDNTHIAVVGVAGLLSPSGFRDREARKERKPLICSY